VISNRPEPSTAKAATTMSTTPATIAAHLRRRRPTARLTAIRRSRIRGSIRAADVATSIDTTSAWLGSSSMKTVERPLAPALPPRSPSMYTASGRSTSPMRTVGPAASVVGDGTPVRSAGGADGITGGTLGSSGVMILTSESASLPATGEPCTSP
jgi:hypothetical protein